MNSIERNGGRFGKQQGRLRNWRGWLLAAVMAAALAACSGPGDPLARVPIIPTSTKVSDTATRDALTSFDLETGEMRFSQSTNLLASLSLDDVLVSEPAAAAPYGYLRKVKAMRTEGDEVVLETTQANLTDAIHQGSLDDGAELGPEDLESATALVDGLVVGPAADLEVGDGYKFEAHFNETVLDINEGDVKTKVTVSGSIYFNAGYHIGIGIEGCFELPPICVDRFEAWVGFYQHAKLRVSGEASAAFTKEKKVAEYRFSPKCFAIGPVPVCIVPTVYVFVGASGEVNLKFDYAADQVAEARIGARWTEDHGWQDIEPTPKFTSGLDQQFDVNAALKARAYAKAEGALMLYGIAGPTIGVKMELELDAAVPRDPFWILRGSLQAYYGFIVDLPIIGRLVESSGEIYTISKEIGRSANSPPKIVVKEPYKAIELGQSVFLGFFKNAGNYVGIYYVFDPEDDVPSFTLNSNLDGPLSPTNHTFATPGLRTITVRATDAKGAVSTATFQVDVINTPPVAFGSVGSATAQQTVPYYISAAASDPNSKLDCSALSWTISAPDTVQVFNVSSTVCYGVAVFNVLGNRSVTLHATDPQGATSPPRVFNVFVTNPPPNPPPVITQPFSVVGCQFSNCFEVPEGGIVYNRYALLSVAATDPDGVTYTFTAQCLDCASTGLMIIGTNTTGVLEYLPAVHGIWRFGVNVTDGTSTISFARTIEIIDPGPN